MAWPLPAVPIAAWLAIVAATWLDEDHDAMAHYISWLVDGDWSWLAAAGVMGLAVSAVLAARHLDHRLPAGWLRDATRASLGAAAVMGLATLVLPSRGLGEPVWRTAVHVGLAVGAYAGLIGAAVAVAWLAWRRRAPRPMLAWAAGLVASLALMLVAAAIARLTDWGLEVRGLAQLVLAGAAAVWLAGAIGMGRPRSGGRRAAD